MLPKKDLNKVIELAKKYKIGKVYLLGSILNSSPSEVNDYDFAIDDYPEGVFFKFYGELFMLMPKDVDIIDLSGEETLFKNIVKREAKLIYEGTGI